MGNAFLEQGRILTSGTSRVQWTRVSFYNLLIIRLQVLLPTSCFDGNRYFELSVAGLDVLLSCYLDYNQRISFQLGSE